MLADSDFVLDAIEQRAESWASAMREKHSHDNVMEAAGRFRFRARRCRPLPAGHRPPVARACPHPSADRAPGGLRPPAGGDGPEEHGARIARSRTGRLTPLRMEVPCAARAADPLSEAAMRRLCVFFGANLGGGPGFL